MMDTRACVESLRLFREKGIRQVSPGALAMTWAKVVTGDDRAGAPPLDSDQMATIARMTDTSWDGTWLWI